MNVGRHVSRYPDKDAVASAAPRALRAVVIATVAAVGASGCAVETWRHPNRSEAQLPVDRIACGKEARERFPEVMVKEMASPPRVEGGQTTCVTDAGNRTTCTTTPVRNVPASFTYRDINKWPRYDAERACLKKLGWVLTFE